MNPSPSALLGGFPKPKHKILGLDIAGRVEAVGRDVKHFEPGDDVFGESGIGTFTEYRCATEDKLAPKPANIAFEEATTIPEAALVALQSLRDAGQIRSGQYEFCRAFRVFTFRNEIGAGRRPKWRV